MMYASAHLRRMHSRTRHVSPQHIRNHTGDRRIIVRDMQILVEGEKKCRCYYEIMSLDYICISVCCTCVDGETLRRHAVRCMCEVCSSIAYGGSVHTSNRPVS